MFKIKRIIEGIFDNLTRIREDISDLKQTVLKLICVTKEMKEYNFITGDPFITFTPSDIGKEFIVKFSEGEEILTEKCILTGILNITEMFNGTLRLSTKFKILIPGIGPKIIDKNDIVDFSVPENIRFSHELE